MKQLGVFVLIAALLLSMCACGQKAPTPEPAQNAPAAPVAPPDQPTEAAPVDAAPAPPADAVIGEAHVEETAASEHPVEESTLPVEPTPSEPGTIVSGPAAEGDLTAQTPFGDGAILTDPESGQEYAADRLILTLEQALSDEELDALLREYDLTLIYHYRNLKLCAVSFPARNVKGLAALIAELERDERISAAERDYVIRLDDPVTVDK